MRTLRIRRIARLETDSAFAWYLARSPKAAARFLDEVDRTMAAIAEAPERYPVVRGQLRRFLVRRFPYGVYYKIFPTSISVVGVIHGHRHPDTWLRRAAP